MGRGLAPLRNPWAYASRNRGRRRPPGGCPVGGSCSHRSLAEPVGLGRGYEDLLVGEAFYQVLTQSEQ